MARKQFGIKFEEGDVAQWDAVAERLGINRTELIERVMARVVSGEIPLAPATPRRRRPGFVGSTLPGHADVPELGWYRPASAEAKQAVEKDVAALRAAAVKKGA